MLERTHGQTPIDNHDPVYTGALPPEVLAMLNAAAQRYERTPHAEGVVERHYEPSGRLAIPMISMHDRWDPTVPLFHEDLYAAKVNAAGRGHFLERRVVDRYGHADFSADEVADALTDLRAKVVGKSALAAR